jgi:hypothetical protein
MPAISSIVVTPINVTITVGETQQFSALEVYSNGGNADVTLTSAWESTDPLVASVDSQGIVTGLSAGTATITATSNGYSGAAAADIEPAPPGETTPPVTPVSPYAELLVMASAQMARYAAGQAVVAIETPQLGRVVYNQTNIADLQRFIDWLKAQIDPTSAVTMRRRPISIEACP